MPGAVSSFQISRDVVQLLDQSVLVNGGQHDALWCSSFTWGCGAGACSAEFALPQYLFDTYAGDLDDALVQVYVANAYDGSVGDTPDFIGNLDVNSAQLDESNDVMRMSANGMMAYLNRVFVGQQSHLPLVEYPLIDLRTGKKTNWTPAHILEDLFSAGGSGSPSGGMPSFYRSLVQLGNTKVLNTTAQNTMPSLTFRNPSYASAIDAILGLFGDVTFCERYGSNGVTYLDFFRVQDPAAARVVVRVGEFLDPIESGANLDTVSHTKTTADSITRFHLIGTGRRFIVSSNSYDANNEKKLQKGWNTSGTLNFEAKVLANTKGAKSGGAGYEPGMELVYRRWHLPSAFLDMLKLKDLAMKREALSSGQEGAPYKVQVWKYPTTLVANEAGVLIGTESTTRQLLTNYTLELDKGYFELGNVEDALNLTKVENSTRGTPKYTWAAAKIGITFCFEDKKHFVYGDTGQDASSGIQLAFASDGLTDQQQRDDMTFIQFTNAGYPIRSASGASLTFPAAFYNEDTRTWHDYTTATVVKDDSPILRMLAHEALRSRNRKHHSWDGSLFYFSRGYRPGGLLTVAGQDNPPPPMMVSNVTFMLEGEQSTRITADNVKPPLRKEKDMWTGTQRSRSSTDKGPSSRGFRTAGSNNESSFMQSRQMGMPGIGKPVDPAADSKAVANSDLVHDQPATNAYDSWVSNGKWH
jgi:hypothetical protein